MGRSIESIAMEYLVRRCIALAVRYCDGLFMAKGLVPLSLNRMIYLENWALAAVEKKAIAMQVKSKYFFMVLV
jgi:hypothetical protein